MPSGRIDERKRDLMEVFLNTAGVLITEPFHRAIKTRLLIKRESRSAAASLEKCRRGGGGGGPPLGRTSDFLPATTCFCRELFNVAPAEGVKTDISADFS